MGEWGEAAGRGADDVNPATLRASFLGHPQCLLDLLTNVLLQSSFLSSVQRILPEGPPCAESHRFLLQPDPSTFLLLGPSTLGGHGILGSLISCWVAGVSRFTSGSFSSAG